MKRSIWVECETGAGPLSSKTSVESLSDFLHTIGIECAYLQVYRRGIAHYKTKLVETAPAVSPEFDPLLCALRALGERGIEVHAWINCCNFGTLPSPKTLAALGAESLIHDDRGNSVSMYQAWERPSDAACAGFSLDTPGAWVDPSAPALHSHLSELAQELTKNYAQLAGIHLDFIRYPYCIPIRPGASIACGIDLGLGPALQRFSQEQKISLPTPPPAPSAYSWPSEEVALAFDSWRRAQVSKLVKSIASIKQIRSTLRLSAAVLTWSDRAYLSAFQDWRAWLDEALLDSVLLMAYTADTKHFSQMIRAARAFETTRATIAAGIGCYKLADAQALQVQLATAAQLGIKEAVLFSYGNLIARPHLASALR